MRKNCRFIPNLDFNPVFTKFNLTNFSIQAYIMQRVCNTSREKRTSKHGISMIMSRQCGVMEKGCISGSYVWGAALIRILICLKQTVR